MGRMNLSRAVRRPALSRVLLYALFAAACAWGAETVRLSPSKVVELAWKQSIAVRSSEYTVRSAGYGKKGAFASFLPSVKGNVSYTRLDEPPSIPSMNASGDMFAGSGIDLTDPLNAQIVSVLAALFSGLKFESMPQEIWNMGVTVSQPLFLGGRLVNAYRLSKFTLQSEEHTHRRTLDQVKQTALQLFWAYVSASEGSRVAEETRAWLENLLNTQQVMFENGMIIEHVLLKTKVGLSQAQLAVLQTKHGVDQLRESLLLFLDLPLDTRIEIDTADVGARSVSLDSLDNDGAASMVSRREDIRAMELRLQSLKILRKIQRGNYLPSLVTAYNYKWANDNYEKVGELDPGWSLSAIFDWPIFDWGKNYREIQKTDCQIAQVTLGLKALREQAQAEVLDAHRKLAESVDEIGIARDGAANARRALEIAELQYDEGTITHVELHEARKELTAADAQLIGARTRKELAAVRYEIAAGQ